MYLYIMKFEVNRLLEPLIIGSLGAILSHIVRTISIKATDKTDDPLTFFVGNVITGFIIHLISEYFRRGTMLKMAKEFIVGPSFVPLATPRIRNVRTVSSKDVMDLFKNK